MVVKVYISGISGNKEVKKRQQRVLMILDSKNIKYDVIDITEPGRESDKEFMQTKSTSNGGTVSDPNPRSPLPPQLFNDEEYCGDYDLFDLANEVDTLEQYLKMEVPPEETPQTENDKEKALNGDVIEESNNGIEANSEDTANADATEAVDEAGDKTETAEKEGSPAKKGTPSRETSKEGTPAPKAEVPADDSKEKSPEKESADRQQSVEKEETEVRAQSPEKEVEATPVKESTPEKKEVNENGTVSSREHSQEKDTPADESEVERKKDSPSETLIQSEQTAAAE